MQSCAPHLVPRLCKAPREVCHVLVVVALQIAALGSRRQRVKQARVVHPELAKGPSDVGDVLQAERACWAADACVHMLTQRLWTCMQAIIIFSLLNRTRHHPTIDGC